MQVLDASGNNPPLFNKPKRNLMVADVDGTSVWSYWGSGDGAFLLEGTPDGATATFQWSLDDGVTAFAVGTDTTFVNAVGGALFTLPKCSIRVLIAAAGAGTTFRAYVSPIL